MTEPLKSGWAADPERARRSGAKGGKAHGPDYRKGGMASKGFAAFPELAREIGARGGAKSKRGKAK